MQFCTTIPKCQTYGLNPLLRGDPSPAVRHYGLLIVLSKYLFRYMLLNVVLQFQYYYKAITNYNKWECSWYSFPRRSNMRIILKITTVTDVTMTTKTQFIEIKAGTRGSWPDNVYINHHKTVLINFTGVSRFECFWKTSMLTYRTLVSTLI